jgi:aminoglycoside 6'-N-acetyltransferase I
MEIQALAENNLTNLINLVLELWPECSFDEEYNSYKNILNAGNETCYLVKENEAHIAFIHLSIRTDYVEGATAFPVGYIEALYVKPDHQQKGIAKLLVAQGENWSKQKGCKEMASDTELNNTGAIAFHKKLGFEEANRIVCFIKNI